MMLSQTERYNSNQCTAIVEIQQAHIIAEPRSNIIFYTLFLRQNKELLRSRYENATPNFCWVSCAINRRDFEIARFPRFEALAYAVPDFDALTRVVILRKALFIPGIKSDETLTFVALIPGALYLKNSAK